MKLEKFNSNYYIKTESNKLIGYFILDIDGSYYLKFEELSGYWSAHTLKEITALLDDVNEPFNKQVIDYFLNEKLNTNCSCGDGIKEQGEYYCRECLNKNPFLCS